MDDERPTFTVIGGPNGSGKSSLARELATQGYDIGQFVNFDAIAEELGAEGPVDQLKAARETLRRTRRLIAQRVTFTRESTLTSSEIVRTMQAAKDAGYQVNLIFVSVVSLATAKERIQDRVAKGGHDIDEAVQERRFPRSLRTVAKASMIADQTLYFDNQRREGYELVGEVRAGILMGASFDRAPWLEEATRGLPRDGEA